MHSRIDLIPSRLPKAHLAVSFHPSRHISRNRRLWKDPEATLASARAFLYAASVRSLLAAREVLVRVRVKLENEIRGLLRTFGVLFGKAAGGFAHRAHEIIGGELDASPPMQIVPSRH